MVIQTLVEPQQLAWGTHRTLTNVEHTVLLALHLHLVEALSLYLTLCSSCDQTPKLDICCLTNEPVL